MVAHQDVRQSTRAVAIRLLTLWLSTSRPTLMAAYNFFGQNGDGRIVTRDGNTTCNRIVRRETIEKQVITPLSQFGANPYGLQRRFCKKSFTANTLTRIRCPIKP